MTPEKLERLKELQRAIAQGRALTVDEQAELLRLRRELAAAPEVADDPTTLADEARRPELDGSGDYFTQQVKRDVRETAEDVGRAAGRGFLSIVGEFFRGLFRRP